MIIIVIVTVDCYNYQKWSMRIQFVGNWQIRTHIIRLTYSIMSDFIALWLASFGRKFVVFFLISVPNIVFWCSVELRYWVGYNNYHQSMFKKIMKNHLYRMSSRRYLPKNITFTNSWNKKLSHGFITWPMFKWKCVIFGFRYSRCVCKDKCVNIFIPLRTPLFNMIPIQWAPWIKLDFPDKTNLRLFSDIFIVLFFFLRFNRPRYCFKMNSYNATKR